MLDQPCTAVYTATEKTEVNLQVLKEKNLEILLCEERYEQSE